MISTLAKLLDEVNRTLKPKRQGSHILLQPLLFLCAFVCIYSRKTVLSRLARKSKNTNKTTAAHETLWKFVSQAFMASEYDLPRPDHRKNIVLFLLFFLNWSLANPSFGNFT